MEKVGVKRRRKMGRPSVEESRTLDEVLKNRALGLFLELGYDGVSMDAIAQAAGITKRTLYARYNNKRELFSDVMAVAAYTWEFDDSGLSTDSHDSLDDALMAVAAVLLTQAIDPEYIKIGRLAASQAESFPDEVKRGYNTALSPRIQTIARVIQQYRDQVQDEYLQDIEITAELFLGLISGLPTRLASFGIVRERELELMRAKQGVALFVRGISH